MRRRRGWFIASAFGFAAAAVTLISCSSLQRTVVEPPVVEGATFVGNKACYECHTNIVRIFPSSPHARVFFSGAAMKDQTGCESCHGAGSKHIAAGGGRRFIVNPGRDPQSCLACHLQVHAEFSLPQRHPVLEGKLNCVQCHDPHGTDIMKTASTGLAMARLNETCAQCHREQAKPHVFEHEALREGCVACHVPHGSVNDKMLTQRDNNLCLRCHAQVQNASANGRLYIGIVDHSTFVSRGACWSAGCHTAIHGSDVNRNLRY